MTASAAGCKPPGRAVFLHGNPSHPYHQALARSVGADFLRKDFLLRWNGIPASRARRYASWLLCSVCFPQRDAYDLILTEGPVFLPLLMRRLGRWLPRQRAAAFLSGETPYFLKARRYPRASAAALVRALRAYDGLLCLSPLLAELTRDAVGADGPPVFTLPPSLPAAQRERLLGMAPELDRAQIISIGNMSVPWRAWYKGLDLMVAAVAEARRGRPDLTLSLAGDIPAEVQAGLAPLPDGGAWLRFCGPRPAHAALGGAGLALQLSRGDGGPISALEAMCAGVPVLVSQWTGMRDVVAEADPRLVVPLDAAAAAARIRWYLDLPAQDKAALSARCRQAAAQYTEERAAAALAGALQRIQT